MNKSKSFHIEESLDNIIDESLIFEKFRSILRRYQRRIEVYIEEYAATAELDEITNFDTLYERLTSEGVSISRHDLQIFVEKFERALEIAKPSTIEEGYKKYVAAFGVALLFTYTYLFIKSINRLIGAYSELRSIPIVSFVVALSIAMLIPVARFLIKLFQVRFHDTTEEAAKHRSTQ